MPKGICIIIKLYLYPQYLYVTSFLLLKNITIELNKFKPKIKMYQNDTFLFSHYDTSIFIFLTLIHLFNNFADN
jgi:hypothetical protein